MTSGKPGRRLLIFSNTSKWRDCLPLNLKAPCEVPIAQARESQPVSLHELLGFDRVGEARVAFLDLDVLLDAAEHAEFRLDRDALGVRARPRRAW
jgi:hypothetical protein